MTATPHTSTTSLAAVSALTERTGATDLELADGRVVSVPLAVNRSSAAEMKATVRRLTAIEIDSVRCSAIAVGIGHRLPFMRPIPMSMALGLVADGVPGVAR